MRALDGLTLHLEPGELVALLGPSGCGKTTALRILAGLDQPTSGTVVVGGKDLTKVPANKRDMGMVFQAYSLFPHLTVLDNVAFGLKLRGEDGSDPTARRAGEARAGRPGRARQALRQPALRRPAAARRAGPRAGHRAVGAAARRAALGPRRQGARAAARRDPPGPARGRHHHAVRHPRPGGGARRRRPGRGDEQGAARAARAAGRALRPPGQHVRRRVRRAEQPGARPTCRGGHGDAAGHVRAGDRGVDRLGTRGGHGAARVGDRRPPTPTGPPRWPRSASSGRSPGSTSTSPTGST